MAHVPGRLTAALALLAGLVLVTGPAIGAPSDDAARRAAEHLAAAQGGDGAVPAGARPDQSADAAVALLASGARQATTDRLVDHLRAVADDGASTGPYAARLAMAAVMAGDDPRSFGGVDLVARIEAAHDPVTGDYGGPNLYADALAMAGLIAADRPVPAAAVRRLVVSQCDDGGWSHREGCLGNPDTDTTSLATAVLARTGGATAAVDAGRSWLTSTRNPSGCWGYEPGAADNANSCALAIGALRTLGRSPSVKPLLAFQHDSGGFLYQASSAKPDHYATVQALPALAGWHLPPDPNRDEPLPTPARRTGTVRAAQTDPDVSTTTTPPDDATPTTADGDANESTTTTAEPSAASRDIELACVTQDEGKVAVAVVVDATFFPDGEAEATCVIVDEGSSSSKILEVRATQLGRPLPTYATSGLLCSIDGQPTDGCGEANDDGFDYWAYFVADHPDEEWSYAQLGPAERRPDFGDVDGWRFVRSTGGDDPPPSITPVQARETAPATSNEPLDDFGPDDKLQSALIGVAIVVAVGLGARLLSRRR